MTCTTRFSQLFACSVLLTLGTSLFIGGCSTDNSTEPEPAACDRISSDGFNTELALELGSLVTIATNSFGKKDPGDPLEACWSLVEYIESPPSNIDVQLMIAKNGATGDLAVAFPGSDCAFMETMEDFDDWRLNVQGQPDDWELRGTCNDLEENKTIPRAVHSGFKSGYLNIEERLREALFGALPAIKDRATARVFFAGFSLGGALATLASLDLVNDLVAAGYERENVVMYSQAGPRAILSSLYDRYSCLVPNSHAITILQDPVPRTEWPTVLNEDTYTHIEKTVILTSEGSPMVTRILRVAGDQYPSVTVNPPGFGTCLAAPATKINLHNMGKYRERLDVVTPDQVPVPRIGVRAGLFEIGTKGGIPEKCEKIAMFRGNPSNNDLLIVTIRSVTDLDGLALTTVPRYANYWVAYFDPFGRMLASKEYTPPTPDLRLSRINLTTVKVEWTVRDRGSLDYIAFYDHKPTNQSPGNYIAGTRIPVFQAEDSAQRLVPPGKDIWVAYVMKDAAIGNSRSKILAQKGPR